jgi:uncharacterized membrane protein
MVIGTALCFVALVGCNKSEPGGPGATNTSKSTIISSDSNTFTMKPPTTTTDIPQGTTKDVKITVDRKKDFKQVVTMTFDGGNKVSFDPKKLADDPSKSGSSVVKVTAAADAPLGKQTITVTATPESGAATSATFDINIKESK